MPTPQEELIEYTKSLILQLLDPALPEEERPALVALLESVEQAAFQAALDNFRAANPRFIELSGKLETAIANLSKPASAAILKARNRLGDIQRLVHDSEGMRTTWQTSAEFEEIFKDEKDQAPTSEVMLLPAPPPGAPPVVAPKPLNSKEYARLADEYVRFFRGAAFSSTVSESSAKKFAESALVNRKRYEAVGDPLGIPWWFIAGVHLLESGFNFTTHLHNGDSLAARTHRVPQGRPTNGNPPFTWEESATDALKKEKLDESTDWSLPRALFRWEAYNGFGYRSRGVPSPYLWSFTTVYRKGKFVGDGVFNASAVSKQCGAVAFLKALASLGQADLKIEGFSEEQTTEETDSANADADAVVKDGKPNIDGVLSTNVDFETFFGQQIPPIRNFKWHEFLVKGGSHQTNGLNTDPPRDLWPNIIPTARVLDRLRDDIGNPLVLTSAYRSPKYNESIGGARRSQHMEFCAIDFKVVGAGKPADWARILKRYRDEGVFEGGIGTYNTFVHVDTRGYRADWE